MAEIFLHKKSPSPVCLSVFPAARFSPQQIETG
jgi:hypothetical protein